MSAPTASKYFADRCTDLLPVEELEERIEYARSLESALGKWENKPEFRLRAEQVAAILTTPLLHLEPGGSLSVDRLLFLRINLDSIAPFLDLQHLADFGLVPRTSYLCDPESPGASDKAWNMISMDPQLYSWWCRGYFAFRYLSMDPIGQHEMNITLEFRWMPQMKRYFGQEIDVYNTGTGYSLQDLIDELHRFHDHGDPAPIADYETRLTNKGATLRSGKLIYIRMETEDANRFKDMIDMQWGCILITVLSGAAGSPQLLANKDSNDRVMQWVQDQARIIQTASSAHQPNLRTTSPNSLLSKHTESESTLKSWPSPKSTESISPPASDSKQTLGWTGQYSSMKEYGASPTSQWTGEYSSMIQYSASPEVSQWTGQYSHPYEYSVSPKMTRLGKWEKSTIPGGEPDFKWILEYTPE
ncbi:hypothetical protein FPANT_6704 [Fusarium pseudoanthophilum]|uniref:HNH nuclease domain-containing protein n=1 Tax=Fusarium pseudoanthophilum TaxID=48495 RepID=A0A8H5LAR3_9HYPO|nr:hypothetical protein FPANT_6704 [Fusarium pseudoanthophilum]